MDKLNFLEYVNEKPVAKLGDYYTNGDIMIHKDFCEEIPEAALIPTDKIGKGDINTIIDRATKYLNYVPYENNEKLGQKMIIDPVYIDFINDLIEDKENVDYIANKYSAIKVMRGDKLIAIVMPKKITLNHEQIKLIMVNNFKEYLAYMDLIPIEYKNLEIDDSRLILKPIPKIVINVKYEDNFTESAKRITHEIRHIFQIYYVNLMNDKLVEYGKKN